MRRILVQDLRRKLKANGYDETFCEVFLSRDKKEVNTCVRIVHSLPEKKKEEILRYIDSCNLFYYCQCPRFAPDTFAVEWKK